MTLVNSKGIRSRCLTCSAPFLKRNKLYKYCSDACREYLKRNPPNPADRIFNHGYSLASVVDSRGNLSYFDSKDIPAVVTRTWTLSKNGYFCYSGNSWVGLHRLIAGVHGQPRSVQVDHINGDKLDNRRSNLRVCTPSQNLMNKPKPPTNTSGFKGVGKSLSKKKPWRASIGIGDRRHKSLGTYATAQEAAFAYDLAALEYHGEFAHLNFQKDASGNITPKDNSLN